METYFDRRAGSLAVALHPEIADEGKFASSTLESLHAPRGHSQEAVKAWLGDVVKGFNIKPTYWAKLAGIAPSTINRFLTSDVVTHTLSSSTIDKLSNALILEAIQSAKDHWGNRREKAKRFFSIPSVLVDAPVIGFVSENRVLAADDTDIELRSLSLSDRHAKTLTIPVPSPWTATRVVGFDVDGAAYGPLYPDGSILACVPIFAMDGPPSAGKRVVVYERLDRGGYKTYLREIVSDPNGRYWFMPISGTESDTAPGLFLYPPQRDPIVKAVFWVIGSYRLEPDIFGAQKCA